MADATVSLKLTPREFDTVKSALQKQLDHVLTRIQDTETAAQIKADLRKEAGFLTDLLKSLSR